MAPDVEICCNVMVVGAVVVLVDEFAEMGKRLEVHSELSDQDLLGGESV